MSELFILLVWIFIARRIYQSITERGNEAARESAKIEMRRDALHRTPQSPASHESLGDALREAGRYRDALLCYENAQSLMTGTEAGGSGALGGGGLETKIRLTRLDIRETAERPQSYIAQVARRESVCRRCSTVNAPDATHCQSCGLDLPTNSFLETWFRDDIRRPILREVGEGTVMLLVVGVCLYACSWMPLDVKGVLLFSTFAVLVGKGMRSITDK